MVTKWYFIFLIMCTVARGNNLCDEAFNLVRSNQLEQAVALYQRAYAASPDNALISYNIAYVYNLMGKHEDAVKWYTTTLAQNPTNGKAHLGKAKAYLSLAKFEEGLPEFEWRMANYTPSSKQCQYQHLNLNNLQGKRILIRAEWGLGDMIQFIRYAQLLKQHGATVFVETYQPLQPLFKLCPYIDCICAVGALPSNIDMQIPCLSLPLLFNTTLTTIPAPIPYLQAEPTLVTFWKKKLAHDGSLKIGICWHAKPIYLEDHLYTKRSIPLELFAPLAKIPGVTLYSLQKVDGLDELKTGAADFTIHDFGPDFDESHGRFMDTAAVIKNLDLIISADTSLVHLAGALGAPVWVLLPYTAEWRWLQQRTDTPWYPHTMRLFRQQKPGNWQSVMQEVATALKTLATQKNKKSDVAVIFSQAAEHIKKYDYVSAITCYKKILADHPAHLSTLKNLSHVLRYQGMMEEAVIYYHQALHYVDDADLHYGLAEAELALGNFKEGWHHFEWRYKRGKDTRHFDHKLWDGVSNLHNKKVLVRAEYGQGDTIQFMRYLPLLKTLGATIILEVQSSLMPLLALCPYVDHVIPVYADGIPDIEYDLQIPIMSLPRLCKTHQEADIPCFIPYLDAKQELVIFWKEKIKNDHNFKIGICWDPSPYYETFKSPLSRKSVPLEIFARLGEIETISLYSLQKMNGLEQLKSLPNNCVIHTFNDFDNSHGRFMDTAALITHLDLIITVDTSIAHVAGALGKPVWILLPYVADWRWMLDRTDSPWYPTMKVFRQKKIGDWQEVMDYIQRTLKELL